jgi:outer membrane protein OmpA-like peptidoglycan-associated protein
MCVFKKCWFLWLLLALWAIISVRWYTCSIKGACDAPQKVQTETAQEIKEIKKEVPKVKSVTPEKVVATPAVTTPKKVVQKEYPMETFTVYFAPNTPGILEGVNDKMQQTADYLNNVAGSKILITGHTNVHSDHAFTNQLGKTRAEKVKQILVNQYKVSPSSISIESKGQTELAADPKTDEAAELNRRAIITKLK